MVKDVKMLIIIIIIDSCNDENFGKLVISSDKKNIFTYVRH